jgi:ribosomal protein S12 methylthiotransferase
VLVDAVEGNGRSRVALARSYAEAPEIDGIVRVQGVGAGVAPGDFLEVDITDSDTYDLAARPAKTAR